MRSILATSLLLALSACSSTPQTSAGDAGADAFTHDLVFTMSMTVEANTELHQCQLVQIPPGADVNVHGFAHEYTTGSHHFLLYMTTLKSIPKDLEGLHDCTTGDEPIMKDVVGIVYGGQVPTGTVSFPDGVATTIPGGQVLIMNAHYLNASDAAIATSIKVGLDTIAPAAVKEQGGFFVFYDPFIDVPAHANASSGARCRVPEDVTVISAFTHYHWRGNDMKVFNDVDGMPRSTTPFFATHDWEHSPELKGPEVWKKGSSIRYQCDYTNPDGVEVFQGPNAKTSEMCVFAGLYYPKVSSAFENCEEMSVSGFGANACMDVVKCVEACPATDAPRQTATGTIVGPCWERCLAGGCDGAVDALLPLFGCVGQSCSAECNGAGTCNACAASKCGMELGACVNQKCP